MTLSASTSAALAKGLALYQEGRFWHAHEAWEEAWLEEEGDVRVLLQGLIQIAAACYKATVQHQPSGCVKLFQSGLDKLVPLPGGFCGVALAQLVAESQTALGLAREWLSGTRTGLDAASLPRLRML